MVEPIEIPDATQEPEAYVARLLETLGDRDPRAVYRQTAGTVVELCGGMERTAWFVPMGPGEWNAHQIVGHLLDVDIVYGFRWRLVLTADVPSYPGYDEKAWAHLPKPPPPDLLESLLALRNANVFLINQVADEQWRRRGIHSEQGPEDMMLMLRKIAGHDLAHINQLQRTVDVAIGERVL